MQQISKIRIIGTLQEQTRFSFRNPKPIVTPTSFSFSAKGSEIKHNINIPLRALKPSLNSPLIYDEILIDRELGKTFHIRRIGYFQTNVLKGIFKANGELYEGYIVPTDQVSNALFKPNSYINSYCDKIPTRQEEVDGYNEYSEFCGNLYGDKTDKWKFRIKASTIEKAGFKNIEEWSIKNPITAYAELLEPIITEIEHIVLDNSAYEFEFSTLPNAIKPLLEIEYEKDYKAAIKDLETDILELNTKVDLKSNSPTKTIITVDTPIWTNQPEILGGGNLSTEFKIWNEEYYFVTLKDTNGSALPSNQFKLTATVDGYATAINQIFTLASLATGNSGTLVENTPIDFKQIGASFMLRNAGVSEVSLSTYKELFIKNKAVFYLYAKTVKKSTSSGNIVLSLNASEISLKSKMFQTASSYSWGTSTLYPISEKYATLYHKIILTKADTDEYFSNEYYNISKTNDKATYTYTSNTRQDSIKVHFNNINYFVLTTVSGVLIRNSSCLLLEIYN